VEPDVVALVGYGVLVADYVYGLRQGRRGDMATISATTATIMVIFLRIACLPFGSGFGPRSECPPLLPRLRRARAH
jgi:hypothetical protein